MTYPARFLDLAPELEGARHALLYAAERITGVAIAGNTIVLLGVVNLRRRGEVDWTLYRRDTGLAEAKADWGRVRRGGSCAVFAYFARPSVAVVHAEPHAGRRQAWRADIAQSRGKRVLGPWIANDRPRSLAVEPPA